jgi:putative intracellular protease/amidase
VPNGGLAVAPRLDLIVVPGGVVATMERDPLVTGWLRDRAPEAEIVASVGARPDTVAKGGAVSPSALAGRRDLPVTRTRRSVGLTPSIAQRRVRR